MLQQKTSEGIILKVIPFQDYNQILTVFTPENGVIKLFCKRTKKAWQRYSPLTKVEVTFKEKKGEIFACEAIALTQAYLQLRGQLTYLQVGCDILDAIHFSQLPGKPAPLLYQLLLFYLDKMGGLQDPWVLAASFKLKILKYEGVGPNFATMPFREEELNNLHLLTHSQKFNELAQLILCKSLIKKIDQLFIHHLE